jgi:hypothetical protein
VLQVGWLTVVGLVADIAGASVLAWDLLPEYRVYRWRMHSKFYHAATPERILELKHYRARPNDPIIGLTVDMSYISPLNSLRRAVGLSYLDFQKANEEPATLLRVSEKEVVEAIEAAAREMHNRWRPPLRSGILLVVIGFLFQLLGQLGSMHLY